LGEPLSTENAANDFVGYEALIDFIDEYELYKLEGDLIEIGAFMGGGTIKLAKYAKKHGKQVFVIDVFDPSFDRTQDTTGTKMCDIYEAFLQGRSQKEIYEKTTRSFDNVLTIEKDSKGVVFPEAQMFMFGFIDGNHQPDYVRSDFSIIWRNLVPGGAVAFHDYNFDLPEVTNTINALMEEYGDDISEINEIKDNYIILLTKKRKKSDTAHA